MRRSGLVYARLFTMTGTLMLTLTAAEAQEISPGTRTHFYTNPQAVRAEAMRRLKEPVSKESVYMIPGANRNSTVNLPEGTESPGKPSCGDLADIEVLLKITVKGLAFLSIVWGGPCMLWGLLNMAAGTRDAMKKVSWGAIATIGGLATPGAVDWLLLCCRNAGFFS